MTVTNHIDVAKKMAALQQTFKQQLSAKVAEISQNWEIFVDDTTNISALSNLYQMSHSLTGSGGTFGAVSVSTFARAIERMVKPLVNDHSPEPTISSEVREQIGIYISQLSQAAEQWEPSDIPYIPPSEPKEKKDNNLIYLADDDELLAKGLIASLEKADYRVMHFINLADFEAACEKEMPAAVLMDMVFPDNDTGGADVLSRLKAKGITCPPLVFISSHSDIEYRLAAARTGARRYFCKPLDSKKLIQTLDGLTARKAKVPYRVLLIDDDEILLEYYATFLREGGMEVKTLHNPLEGLKVLSEFHPDIVVLDVYMPECTGPELAQVIRQDDTFSQIPIVFLSTESELHRQLAAMHLGGDEFLVKPIEPHHLVAAVVARAERARWARRLNNDLQVALQESEFHIISSDRHNIVSTTDIAGRITHVNDKLCEISGYSREELLGQTHSMLKSGFHPGSFYEEMWQTITSGNVWHGTICNKNKSGREYWVDSTIVPFLDVTGAPYKYVSVRTDVTALRQSEERLYRSQVFANIGTWDWNVQTGELYWSDRIWPLFGYVKELTDNTYDNFLAAVHPDDRQNVVDAVSNCVEQGADYDIEHRVVWPDGSIHWVHEQGDVVRTKDGVPQHMLGVVHDIDTRKRTELVLAESERQLLEAQSLASIGSWQANIVSGELTWSNEIYRIFGYEPNSFKPSVEAFHAAVHPDDRAKVKASEKRAEKTGQHNVVHRIIQPNGIVRHVHELAQVELDSAGNMVRMTGTVQDVTETVEIELALHQSQQSLRSLFELSPLGIALTDMDGDYLEFNEAFQKICGYPAEELKTLDYWTLTPKDYMDEEAKQLELLKETGRYGPYEKTYRQKDGSMIPIRLNGMLMKDQDGKQQIWSIVEDVSESKRAERALVDARDEAENANRAKSKFLSSMSHELRTPMNAIIGFSQLLTMETDSPLNESQSENVNEISKAGNHLLELINEVLDLAKIEAGHVDLSVETIILDEVVSESLQLIFPLAKKRGIDISLIQDGVEISFEELSGRNNAIRADRTRLRQVLLNLLSNAVKYNNENGKIIIACEDVENNQTRISISDTGVGMTSEQQTHLFKAFSRMGAEHSEIEGTGIGLVITKNIVELMGGNIGVDSQPGVGSTFWLELPGDSQYDSQGVAQEHSPDEGGLPGGELTYHSEDQRTVLYIEDNPANLRLVNQLLGYRPNIHMWSAHEPLLGLELAAEHKPDLILLDINLPGMNGYDVLKHLRQRKETCDTPVIAISANAMTKDIEKGIDAGFDEYITKPIDVNDFLAAVDTVFSTASNEH